MLPDRIRGEEMKKFLVNLDEYVLIGGLWALLIMVFVQVLLRYFLGVTWNWIEEVCRFLFLWMVWLGAGFAAKRRAHLKIEAFISKLRPRARFRVDLTALIIWIIFASFLAWTGAELTWMLIRRHQTSPVLQIPMALPYAAVPTGVAMMLFHLLRQLWECLRPPGKRTGS
jgi:TRAP-type C4-dicarboxylate transport system permease small subunit